jgi:hypothetical protein
MDNFITPKDTDNIRDFHRSMREQSSRRHRFYLVNSTTTAASGNPMDPIFGEPVDSFSVDEAPSTTSGYAPFEASIQEFTNDVGYDEGGFSSASVVAIDVDYSLIERGFDFSLGSMVMIDALLYRVDGLEPRGITDTERMRINLRKVT